MESTKRNISLSLDSAKPLRVMYRRSTSLPTPDDCENEPKTNLVARNKSIRRDITDQKMNDVPTGGIRIQQKKASCYKVHSEFLGFGATPPRANTKAKQFLHSSFFGEGSQGSLVLLKDAERLVQNVLQDFTVNISQETISRAIQRNSVLLSKKRYSSLLEKPWRITSHALQENAEVNGSDFCAQSNTEMIRRSLSSDSITLPSSVDELVHAKKALEQANERILSLQKDLEMLRYENESVDKPKNENDDSLSSTNIDDEGEIMALASTVSFVSDTSYDDIRPPLDFVRAPSPEHRSTKKGIGSDNFVSRLEYRALQIRNEQLLKKISHLENELSPNAIDGLNDDASGRSMPEVSSHESEKEAISGILSKLTHIDISQQVEYMETKITALIKELQQSESKCLFLTDNEIVAKATIENLSTQLLECEQKAKEFNERLIVQTENRLKDSNQHLMRVQQELDIAKEDFSLMKSARLAAESKCLQLEQMHSKVVSSLQSQLNHAESKSQRLQGEVDDLMATAIERMHVKTEYELLQNKWRQSENRLLLLQSNDDSIRQVAVKEAQDRADVRIAQLEVELAAANAENEIATQRLTNLELAQAKEQEILSEELRESETTIAYLMEEIASLKLLSTNIVTLEKLLEEKQADYVLKEIKLDEATAALARSEAEVEDLRNELGLLTSLPEILRKMEIELKIAYSKLAESGERSFDVEQMLELNSVVVDQENIANECNLKVFEMEKTLVFNESNFFELTSLLATQNNAVDAADTKSAQLKIEYAALIAERDSLRENLALLTSKVFDLETEIEQKDSEIQNLMMRQNNGNLFESLRDERDRTLERCTCLSLQLTESQFKIDRLTEQLRSMQKNDLGVQQQQTASRPGALFQTLISTGIDRISSRLDDSLPGLKRGSS